MGECVVSIGNLTVGGTGKTPAVMAVAEEAIKRELAPCILTRGYRGSASVPAIVSRGEGPLLSWAEAGDEPFLMAERLRGVSIIKDPDRYRGGMTAEKVDFFLLDDGFQHQQLYRDLDILLVDATNPFGNGRLLPAGPLREPVKEAVRADIILINKGKDASEELEGTFRRWNTRAPIFHSDYHIDAITALKGDSLSLDILRSRGVFLFSGIGNPSHFLKTFSAINIPVKGSIAFRDHHRYRERDIKRIMKRAEASGSGYIITTEKDMIKVRNLWPASAGKELAALKISLEVNDRKFYDIIFKGIAG